MDGSFFGILRSLLGRHPGVYGSAFKAALRRVATRA
jgi:hypothetical protein